MRRSPRQRNEAGPARRHTGTGRRRGEALRARERPRFPSGLTAARPRHPHGRRREEGALSSWFGKYGGTESCVLCRGSRFKTMCKEPAEKTPRGSAKGAGDVTGAGAGVDQEPSGPRAAVAPSNAGERGRATVASSFFTVLGGAGCTHYHMALKPWRRGKGKGPELKDPEASNPAPPCPEPAHGSLSRPRVPPQPETGRPESTSSLRGS